MFKNTAQKGTAHLLLILVILAGLAAGVYLVQQKQLFKPKASTEDVITVCTQKKDTKDPCFSGNDGLERAVAFIYSDKNTDKIRKISIQEGTYKIPRTINVSNSLVDLEINGEQWDKTIISPDIPEIIGQVNDSSPDMTAAIEEQGDNDFDGLLGTAPVFRVYAPLKISNLSISNNTKGVGMLLGVKNNGSSDGVNIETGTYEVNIDRVVFNSNFKGIDTERAGNRTLLVTNSTFSNSGDAGIDLGGNTKATISFSYMHNNSKEGVYVKDDANIQLFNDTIVRNHGAVTAVDRSVVSLVNTIVAENQNQNVSTQPFTARQYKGLICYMNGRSSIQSNYSIFYQNTEPSRYNKSDGNDCIKRGENVSDNIDPLLNGDMSVNKESPAVGKGSDGSTIGAYQPYQVAGLPSPTPGGDSKAKPKDGGPISSDCPLGTEADFSTYTQQSGQERVLCRDAKTNKVRSDGPGGCCKSGSISDGEGDNCFKGESCSIGNGDCFSGLSCASPIEATDQRTGDTEYTSSGKVVFDGPGGCCSKQGEAGNGKGDSCNVGETCGIIVYDKDNGNEEINGAFNGGCYSNLSCVPAPSERYNSVR